MKSFWIRIGIFVLLWVYMIITYSPNPPISILFFSIALGLFFFLSLEKYLVFLYGGICFVIFLHGFLLIEEAPITVIIMLYVATVSAFQLKEKHQTIYLVVHGLLIFGISLTSDNYFFELLFISFIVYFFIVAMNHFTNTRIEQEEIYHQLLGEYRKLKRMNLVAEDDARLQERNRIARDIHDSVGHRLTALIMQLEVLAIQENNESFRELKQMAEESLEETRHAVKALQSDENEGIASVVHLIRRLEAESHITVQFTTKQGVLSVKLSNNKSVVLYRVIQEALTNAMRHAQSREIRIILGKSAVGDLTFEIINTIYHTRGFEFGFGLTNLKKRVEEINGNVDVYQTEDQFIVKGTIPVQ
ncbi:histidine kinase [Ornithinibacillus salinisoli]|uniref:histidine kinase n=1 Tax=Ornithinibacillus salinisoli TaxID=1848459 RepID=A0ABW4VWC7_9BACI